MCARQCCSERVIRVTCSKNANKLPSWIEVSLLSTYPLGRKLLQAHFEKKRCESEQQQLHWNAALINLLPGSHWMCLPLPTQASINRLLKGSVKASFLHIMREAPLKHLNVKRWRLMCSSSVALQHSRRNNWKLNFGSLCLTCVLPITWLTWVCLLLQEAKLDASGRERTG